ncbi:alpha/beta hydrolase [Clostridium sp. Marseille-Q2269]|uniref:alpha/beta fold hydrolase n=1 Tax=Clostridium sp. Marseille-Q2269 TaxID=2942205 RepID=UPI002073B8FB|nr:alpha/beta hydrolase [Clostridium sp. Marseille-Q2269]
MECKIKDLSINYEIIGNGKPIIMLHGYAADHRLMKGCMEPIFNHKSNYKRIYIDLPGMGKSESSQWITNSDTMLDIVIEFINNVIPNENFLLAGESYGGYLSRGIIYKLPHMVDGVLLICPVIIANHKKRNVPKHIVLVKDNKLLSTLSSQDAKSFNSMTVVQNENIYKKYTKEIMSGIKIANKSFLKSIKKNGYEFSFNVDHINNKFHKPALILLGKQDSCVGYKDAWNILNNFPRATFAVLDRAGHNLQIEQEELFTSLVNEWLIRIN